MSEVATDTNSIGARLQELRTEHRYSIRGLADKAKVSASMVSDIEKGKSEPSISTLNRLASALGTTITYFFLQQAQGRGRVVRARDRVTLGAKGDVAVDGSGTSGAHFELASPPELKDIKAIHGVYDVGAWYGEEPLTHEGEEWGMVLSGRLKVTVGDEVYFLDSGDSIWFPSSMPHRMENVARTPTRALWINASSSS